MMTRTVGPKTQAYPYTGLLSKHVRSINNSPIFYFEVRVLGANDNIQRIESKSQNFAVGLSTCDFQGVKLVGETKESIGISGEGKVQYIDDNSKQFSSLSSVGNFEFQMGITFGIGYIFKT